MFLNLMPMSITHTWSKSGCVLWFPDVCILVYFRRIKEGGESSSSFGFERRDDRDGVDFKTW